MKYSFSFFIMKMTTTTTTTTTTANLTHLSCAAKKTEDKIARTY